MIVITGASGYLGGALYDTARRTGPVAGTSSTGGGLFRLSLREPEDFDYGIVNAGDTVFMAAGISSPDACSREPDHAWNVNVEGTSVVISNILSSGARVVFLSSDTVYGEREDEVDESASCRPEGVYAVMKREVEERFAEQAAFKSVRLSLVFSYEDKFTAYLRECASRRNVAEIYHPFRRAVVHLDDVTEGLLALSRRWSEVAHGVINFGGPEVITRTRFACTLRETALPDLRYQVIDPGSDFFKSRPRVIRMKSPILAFLLNRPPRPLREAARHEFSREDEARHA